MVSDYHYTDCGLDNVVIEGISLLTDDVGEAVISIPNVKGLHRAIAEGIVEKRSGLTGRELRFLRTELGLTQAELALLVHREPLTISRWERGEIEIEPNAEALIRLHTIEALDLSAQPTVEEMAGRTVPSAGSLQLRIDGSDPSNYRPLAA